MNLKTQEMLKIIIHYVIRVMTFKKFMIFSLNNFASQSYSLNNKILIKDLHDSDNFYVRYVLIKDLHDSDNFCVRYVLIKDLHDSDNFYFRCFNQRSS